MKNSRRLAVAAWLVAACVAPVSLASAEPVPSAAPAQIQDADVELDQKTTAAYGILDQEQYARAEAAFIALVAEYPARPEPYYHLACCYSRWAKKLDGAERDEKLRKGISNLRESARKGWSNLNHMANDPDLEMLRDLDEYTEIVNIIRRRAIGPASVAEAEPLAFQEFVPAQLGDRRAPALVYCHETGSTAAESLRRMREVCARQSWVLIAIEAPMSIQEGNERMYGWTEFSELRILRTIREMLGKPIGGRIDHHRVMLAGNRQGAFYALSAALVDPELVYAVFTINAPIDIRTFPDERMKAVAGKLRLYDLHSTSDVLGLADARETFARFRSFGVDARFREVAAGPAPEDHVGDHIADFVNWYDDG